MIKHIIKQLKIDADQRLKKAAEDELRRRAALEKKFDTEFKSSLATYEALRNNIKSDLKRRIKEVKGEL